MTKPNGQARYSGGANKYEGGNRYESPDATPENTAETRVPQRIEPMPVRVRQEWQSRPTPGVSMYLPQLGDDFASRWKGRRLAEDYNAAGRVADAATRFHQGLTSLEHSRQELELASERRALVPLKAEQERLALGGEIIKGRIAFESVQEEQNNQRIERMRRRSLDSEDFEIARHNREAAKLEALARVKAAEAQVSYAEEVGTRRGEAELRRVDEEVFRNEAAAETERRRRDDARRKRRESEDKTEADDMPEPLRKHLATERAVQQSHNHVDRRATEIRERAAAEGRELTPDEVEEIHAFQSAGEAAEGSIRRGEASDFEI